METLTYLRLPGEYGGEVVINLYHVLAIRSDRDPHTCSVEMMNGTVYGIRRSLGGVFELIQKADHA